MKVKNENNMQCIKKKKKCQQSCHVKYPNSKISVR